MGKNFSWVFVVVFAAGILGCRGEVVIRHGRDIQLDEAADLMGISRLRVGPDGSFLVVDAVGRNVFLFGPDGALRKKIDPSFCRPDIRDMPTSADISNRFIFLSNSDDRGYVFDTSGECLSDVDASYRPFRHLGIVSDTSLAGIRSIGTGMYRFELASIEGKVFFSADLPETGLPASDENVQGGGFDIGNQAAYFAPPISPVVYEVSPSGNVRAIDMSEKVGGVTPEVDLPRSIGPNNIRQARLMAAESTRNDGVYILSETELFLQYLTPEKGYTWIVMDRGDPNSFRRSKGLMGFMDIQGGKGYHVKAPRKGEDRNPVIEVYRISE